MVNIHDSSIFQKVLITGGGGFIGSNLVATIRSLVPESEITVVDNFVTGRKENTARWQNDSQITLVEHDLTDLPWLTSFLQSEARPWTLILHFASPASPPRYQAEPVLTYQVNSIVTHYLAEYSTHHNSRMLFASTSEVYGDPLEHPQRETYWGNVNPNGIRSCYDEAKRLGESICGVWHRDHGGDIRIIRIFNTYGPHMDPYDGRVIPDFCLQALQKKPLSIFGDGLQTRSFCFVEDLVSGIMSFVSQQGLNGETINLGNPDEFTMLELAEKIEDILGYSVTQTFHPLPADDPKRRKPDITKARTLLDWQPTISLEQGLHPTLSYFKNIVHSS